MKLKIVAIVFLLTVVGTNYAVRLPKFRDLYPRLYGAFPRIPVKRNNIIDDLAGKEMELFTVLTCVEKELWVDFGDSISQEEMEKLRELSQQFLKVILQDCPDALADLRYMGFLNKV